MRKKIVNKLEWGVIKDIAIEHYTWLEGVYTDKKDRHFAVLEAFDENGEENIAFHLLPLSNLLHKDIDMEDLPCVEAREVSFEEMEVPQATIELIKSDIDLVHGDFEEYRAYEIECLGLQEFKKIDVTTQFLQMIENRVNDRNALMLLEEDEENHVPFVVLYQRVKQDASWDVLKELYEEQGFTCLDEGVFYKVMQNAHDVSVPMY